MSNKKRNDVRAVRIDGTLAKSLRRETVEVLELEHGRFESFADRSEAEQKTAVAIFRDAFGVLDTIGWGSEDRDSSVDVQLNAEYVDLLQARRCDRALAVVDRLDYRDQVPEPAEVAARRTANLYDGATTRDLGEIIARFNRAARSPRRSESV